jgi:tRNA modification GTPase
MSPSSPAPCSPADCRVVLLTPSGRGAVATVLVEGGGAIDAVSKWFRAASGKPLNAIAPGTIVFGYFVARDGREEEVVVCPRAAGRIEVNCHGGKAAAGRIVAALTSAGCRQIPWQDWVRSGEPDSLAAEARIALAEAPTLRTAAILLDQYRGALRMELQGIIALVESPDAGDTKCDTIARLERLANRAALGTHLTNPWRVVIAGRPNVGKSSLINALLGYQRSIVYDHPGTTRDALSARTALDGWPVELVDTAGLGDSGDALEAAGVAMARKQIHSADLVVLVFDRSYLWSPDDQRLVEEFPSALRVHNKCDLPPAEPTGRPEGIATSALRRKGIEVLASQISSALVPAAPSSGEAVPFTRGQIDAIHAALALARRAGFREAASRLRELAAGDSS